MFEKFSPTVANIVLEHELQQQARIADPRIFNFTNGFFARIETSVIQFTIVRYRPLKSYMQK